MSKWQYFRHAFGRHCWHITRAWVGFGQLANHGTRVAVPAQDAPRYLDEQCCYCGTQRTRLAETMRDYIQHTSQTRRQNES